MPSRIDRRIADRPRWQRLCIGALPGLLLALAIVGALALTGDRGKAMLGILGEGLAAWLLLPVLSAISGLLVNVASERYLAWEREARATRDFFQNHDLAQLVGRSIGMVLRAVASELGRQDAALVHRLAARAESHWADIALADSARTRLGSIDERRLVEFVARPARSALTPAQTLALLACLNPDRPDTPPEFAETAAESRVRLALATRFGESVRQALKQDAALDGRTAYAMQLDIANRVLTKAAANLERSAENAAALAAVRGTLDELLPRLAAQGIVIGAGIADLGQRLACIEQVVREEGERNRDVVRETAESTQLQIAAMEDRLVALLQERQTPKTIGETPEQEPLSPELMAKVRELYARGQGEKKARAAIELKEHEEADRLVQDLKREPLAEAFRLLILEGDNWYNAGEFDRAIGPYEQALALRPQDPRAMYSAAIAHLQARLGDIAAHQRKAIALLTQAQGTWTRQAHPTECAATQVNLGNAWLRMPTGDRAENLGKAIAAYGRALEVCTREADPVGWAATQNNLGNAWSFMPTGDRAENLGKAIAAYGRALEVCTREADPVGWAATQNNLGVAWSHMPTGDRTENLGKAIAAYGRAMEVRTHEADPTDWAMTQNNLGEAWRNMPTGDRAENLGKAIAACALALEVYTRKAHPTNWAMTQNNLGAAWAEMPIGDRAENLGKAIAAFGLALEVRTREAHPADWAATQDNLAIAWLDMPNGDRAENFGKAIAAFGLALEVRTREAHPTDWAMTQNNLGAAWWKMSTGDRAKNLGKAIAAYGLALEVRTRKTHPADWAETRFNLGLLYWDRAYLGGGRSDLGLAIASVQAAASVFTDADFPGYYRNSIAPALEDLHAAWIEGGHGTQAEFDAISPAE
jgi:tetratricopeptide (TPR) repeat protein